MTTLRRFLTRLIWLCVLPLLLLSVALAVEHVLDTQRVNEEAAQRLVRNIAGRIDQDLGARIGALQILAASPLATQPERVADLYLTAQGFRRSFDSHVVFGDVDGGMWLHTGVPLGEPLPRLPQPAGRSAAATAISSLQPAVGDLFEGPVSRESMIAVVAPGVREGRAAFTVVNAVSTRHFERLLRDIAMPDTWSMTLLDSRGGVIAVRQARDVSGSAQRRFSAQTTLGSWTLALDIPRLAYFAPLAQVSMEMLLAVAGVTVAALLGGHWAGRKLARSVGALAEPPDAAPASVIDIAEIAQARRRLDDAAHERRRAEDELQRSALSLQVREAQLRGIFDSASDAIITADRAQDIVMANAAAARMFGCRVDELVGAPLELLIPERYRERHRELVRAFGESEADARPMTVGRELSGLRLNGEEFPIEAAISHVHVDGQRLFTAILRDISERRRVERELRASKAALEVSHADLQRLIAAQDSVQEFERKRIARELHDDLQQTLAAIMMDVSAIRGEPAIDRSRLAAMLSRIESLAGAAITSTRRIVNDLRPQMLEELGLAAALDALAAQFGERSGIACDFEADERALALESQASPTTTCLFRVAQESLNNVAKHAQARHVVMRLAVDAADRLTLTIRDDGKGLAVEDRRKARSFGLMGMAERVRAVGGALRVDSRPGAGTVVDVKVPVTAPEPA